jgi:hypothetical protein
MSNQDTVIVQVVKNQNNSNELFEKWNTGNQTNIKCSKHHCDNDVNENAYIVIKNSNMNQEFIVPLCQECYNQENNTKNQSTSEFTDFGTIISVYKNLLVENI